MVELAIANRNINIADSNRFDNPFLQKNKKTFAQACKCFLRLRLQRAGIQLTAPEAGVDARHRTYAFCDSSASACLSAIES